MTDENLIEEARIAIHGAIPGTGDYASWADAHNEGFDFLGDIARAAFAVFEKAQREPSDMEVLAALNGRELSVRERSGSARHFTPAPDLSYYGDGNTQDMRAALRAAGVVAEEPDYSKVTRFTVVTEGAGVFEQYGAFSGGIRIALQDEGRTIKILPAVKP